MRIEDTPIAGVKLIEPEPAADERGSFARLFDRDAFLAAGLPGSFEVGAASQNARAGTLRGMHWQREPHPEQKLVGCPRGAVYDVALDLRPDSATFRRWHAVELSAAQRRSLFIPAGVAHGFQTLADDSEVSYLIAGAYEPGAQAGVRWDDPAFAIEWPPAPGGRVIAERDLGFPDFAP